ncbi:MAG: tRNA lysidine(34) synthetase TilS [Alphaproteobacteria bacterium]|nr:tRNA lysidine(34) synthetase TilS [Alphaproteobacteria bacterium]
MINEALEQFFCRYPDIGTKKELAIAVSGGPDSMALAHALVSDYSDKNFHIITVNHGLREEASQEVGLVRRWTEGSSNIKFVELEWVGDKPDTGVMAAARDARYQLMTDYCLDNGLAALFVAHHQDDQAETFLIRLAKGSGIDGLSAMGMLSQKSGVFIARPFLSLPKVSILAYCNEHNVPFATDPSNENDEFLRPRLRAIQGVLGQEGLTPQRLSKLSSRIGRAGDALNVMSEKAYSDCCLNETEQRISIKDDLFQHWPEEISLRVLKAAMEKLQPEQEYATRLEKVEDLHETLVSAYNQKQDMKKRSLGHCLFSYSTRDKTLTVEKE